MTDSSTPSVETDQSSASPSRASARPRSPYVRERTAVGLVFLLIVGAIIVNGAIQIHRDTFRVPPPSHAIANCSEEIARLYTSFAAMLLPVRLEDGRLWPQRPSTDPRIVRGLRRLDEDLLALRPYCAREGSRALEAYTSLMLWRYQAEDLARVEEQTLTSNAERALRYRSPAANPKTAPGYSP